MVGWNHSTRDVSYTLALVFCFNATATTEIYTYRHTLSLHDALPICRVPDIIKELREYGIEPLVYDPVVDPEEAEEEFGIKLVGADAMERSEEHTSELQSLMRISYAVFCLKKNNINNHNSPTVTAIITKQVNIRQHVQIREHHS